MYKEKVREIHALIMTLMGTIHEKFFQRLWKHQDFNRQITKNQSKLISILYRYDDITATELARMLDIEKGSLTTMIDQLQEMGLVIREIDPHDRRKLLLSLSPAGEEQVEKMMELYDQILVELFHKVEPDEMDSFIKNLRQVVEFIGRL
ncbi:MAG: MarR family winged helix-turn-helix transcriptional regulator [Syntrophomonadaceae bacterium]|jgi:DNA-binding MarR family transcriptional regulator